MERENALIKVSELYANSRISIFQAFAKTKSALADYINFQHFVLSNFVTHNPLSACPDIV